MKVIKYILPALFIISLSIAACKKSGPAEAVIVVTDSLGKRISGATVILRQDSVINPVNGTQAMIHETKITDISGQATFTFKLEAVLILEASKGTLTARDFIRLEQSKQVSKSVIIR